VAEIVAMAEVQGAFIVVAQCMVATVRVNEAPTEACYWFTHVLASNAAIGADCSKLRCAFFDRVFHSRMLLVPTPAHLKQVCV
jgi:hypothetical protein